MHRFLPPLRVAFASVVLALAPSGCGELGTLVEGSAGFEVTDSAGVQIASNGRTGPWGPEPRTVREVLRIGVVEGDDPYELSRVNDVEVDAEGRILVGNDQTGTVRVFDAEGGFIREFGGRGEGPGEFYSVNRVVATGADVTVVDWQVGGRTTRFSLDGRVLATWRHTDPDGGRVTPVLWTPAGWLADRREQASPPPALPPGTPDSTARELHRLEVGTPRVAGHEAIRLPPSGDLFATEAGEGRGRDWGLFSSPQVTDVDAEGRIHVIGGVPYRIEVYSPAGELVRIVRREYDPQPADVDAEVEAHMAFAERMFLSDEFPMGPDQGRAQLEQYRERVEARTAFPPPAHRPPARAALVSPDGGVWVERIDHLPPGRVAAERNLPFSEGELAPLPSVWDVFDAEGRLLGQAELPAPFTAHRARGLRVYGVLQDELDVEYVVAYEVEPEA